MDEKKVMSSGKVKGNYPSKGGFKENKIGVATSANIKKPPTHTFVPK